MTKRHLNEVNLSRQETRQYVSDALLDYGDDALSVSDLHRVVQKRMLQAGETRTTSHQTA